MKDSTTAANGLLKSILIAGIIAGTMDATGATIAYLLRGGENPIKIWNYVGSGIFGEASIKGGMAYALMGLLFHYIIAIIWTTIFFKIHKYLLMISKNWIVLAIIYGIVVWVGMNLIVVPLSNTPKGPMTLNGALIAGFVLIICIGSPISYLAKKYYSNQSV